MSKEERADSQREAAAGVCGDARDALNAATSPRPLHWLQDVAQAQSLDKAALAPRRWASRRHFHDLVPLSEKLGIPPLKIGHPEILGKLF